VAGLLAVGGVVATFVAIFGSSGDARALSQVDSNAVGLVDPVTNRILDEVTVGATPGRLALGAGAVWVTNADDNTVSRIDLAKREVVQTIGVGNQPSGITVGGGAVWVADSLGGTVSRIDPTTNTVVQTIAVGSQPSAAVAVDIIA